VLRIGWVPALRDYVAPAGMTTRKGAARGQPAIAIWPKSSSGRRTNADASSGIR